MCVCGCVCKVLDEDTCVSCDPIMGGRKVRRKVKKRSSAASVPPIIHFTSPSVCLLFAIHMVYYSPFNFFHSFFRLIFFKVITKLGDNSWYRIRIAYLRNIFTLRLQYILSMEVKQSIKICNNLILSKRNAKFRKICYK